MMGRPGVSSRALHALLSTVLLGVLAGCAINPVTGRRELSLVSERQEINLGRAEAQKVETQIGLYPDSAVQAYVASIGLRLAHASERPNLPWSFQVVDDASVNAFALPGGFIFVTRGILTHLNSEAELAAVLGHEIGHVTARHSVQAISRQQVAQVGLGIGSLVSSTVRDVGGVAGAGLGILFLKYGRDDEDQADALGFRYALRDGYDVRAMSDVFRTLERVSASAGAGRVPQWLSTHPDPSNRVEKNEARLASLGQDLSGTVLNRNTFLNQLDGMVFGENPRLGFFEGSAFYHPDLRFQIVFPEGWQTANRPDAVVAGNQEGNAIASLTIETGVSTVDSAYRAFAGAAGITVSGRERTRINGLPAVTTGFRAATDQSTLVGEAAFILHRGSIFRVLGYSTSAAYRANEDRLRQSIRSFAAVTDPAVLNRQPERVHVVRLTRDTQLRRFHSNTRSTVPLEQLALINSLAVDATLRRGGTFKSVR